MSQQSKREWVHRHRSTSYSEKEEPSEASCPRQPLAHSRSIDSRALLDHLRARQQLIYSPALATPPQPRPPNPVEFSSQCRRRVEGDACLRETPSQVLPNQKRHNEASKEQSIIRNLLKQNQIIIKQSNARPKQPEKHKLLQQAFSSGKAPRTRADSLSHVRAPLESVLCRSVSQIKGDKPCRVQPYLMLNSTLVVKPQFQPRHSQKLSTPSEFIRSVLEKAKERRPSVTAQIMGYARKRYSAGVGRAITADEADQLQQLIRVQSRQEGPEWVDINQLVDRYLAYRRQCQF